MTSGGKRIGAGRKAVDARLKRVQMIITISPATRDRIRLLAKEQGLTPGKLIDKLMEKE